MAPGRCSPGPGFYSCVAVPASVLVWVPLAYIFLPSFLPPSIYYLSSRSPDSPANGSLVAVGLTSLYPTDSHGAVLYRGAPWRSQIGVWLSRCDSAFDPVDVVESINNKDCKNNCSSRGVCNRDLGHCRCFHGFAGEGCTEQLDLKCNLPSTPEMPYGPWIVSICSSFCDPTRAMCFCGEGTAYPNRPVPESCGFQIILPSKPGDVQMTNWSQPDENIYTTNKSKLGWCNVDPQEAYASKANYKQECHCTYDGFTGRFCEIPVESSCINQCSLHGRCRGGSCECNGGWYGLDCSIPSDLSSIRDWPDWLRPTQVDEASRRVTVKKKRPLIYVYDLPPEFHSHLVEGRHYKYDCVYRLYNSENRTEWTEHPYAAQMALLESILASPHRTKNGEEADYFYIPAFDSCIIKRADDSPHFLMKKFLGLRSYITLDIYRRVYDHIVEQYPYWNRNSGKDHIWFMSWDEGACYAPKEIWNSIMVVHWGNTNSKHNHSTTAYGGDNWDAIPSEKRGDHPCFDHIKDIILPSWKTPVTVAVKLRLWARPREERKTLFYFNGNLGPAYEFGRIEETYSMGIRQRIGQEFGSTPDKKGRLGKQHADDVIVTPVRSSIYANGLANSRFCGVFPGDGWSARLEDSIFRGCIPVIVQDGIFLPYENILNYNSFAVRIAEDDIPNMINILRRFNDTQIDAMLANVRSILPRFLFRNAILLEAERQKRLFGTLEDWAVEYSNIEGDDVFDTFLQILSYKLYNDPWRTVVHNMQKDHGLSRTCLREAEEDSNHGGQH